MATAQTSKSNNDKNKKTLRSTQSSSAQSETGERDENYNLISVLYHSLQAAETASQYKQDAEGDEKLAEFFEQARMSNAELAQQAKVLLASRLEDEGVDDDEEEDDE